MTSAEPEGRTGGAARSEFRVDFSRWSGPPLVKTKFGIYETPFLSQKDLLRSTALMSEAGVRDLRYEMGWGKPDVFAFDQIAGTAAHPTIDFAPLDPFFSELDQRGIRPMLALSYCPVPLQTRTGWQAWKDVPNDLAAWRAIARRYAEHYRTALGLRGPLYEIWNEPDMPGDGLKMFFSGIPSVYGALYRSGAAGVRSGDPDALVGGPAIAYDHAYVTPVLAEPVDFISIHGYDNFAGQITGLRRRVQGRPSLPILLTEYASFKEYGPDAPVSRHPGAMRFFRDVNGLLNETDVTTVYWAQWVDDYIGMVTRDFHRKALFNALKIYQTMLPVDRSPVSPPSANDVNLLAASDANNAGIVIWNESTEDRAVALSLDRLPFQKGEAELYRIDREHASYRDRPVEESLSAVDRWPVGGGAFRWIGTVPAESVAFLKLSDGSKNSLLRPVSIGLHVRDHNWFPDRGEPSGNYADYDPRTSIARLGLGSRDYGTAQSGVVLDRVAPRIRVGVKREGPFRPEGNNALFGIRVDYATKRGGYSRSVLWHDGSFRRDRDARLPWGTRTASVDDGVRFRAIRNVGSFTMDIAAKAPGDWNGRVLLTPILQDMGAGSRARFILTPPGNSQVSHPQKVGTATCLAEGDRLQDVARL